MCVCVFDCSCVVPSAGSAHSCVLQQCDVSPLLFGHNAVAHIEGNAASLMHMCHTCSCKCRCVLLTLAVIYL